MFNRRELKENAKALFKKSYGMGVLVTLLFGLIGGKAGYTFTVDLSPLLNIGTIEQEPNLMESYQYMLEEMRYALQLMAPVLLAVISFTLVVSLCFQFFVGNPLIVGFRRWYLDNRTGYADLGTLGNVFSAGYLNVVKVMFCKNLYTFLWTLLFIVPGIIKTYEYRMVPYLLAENPHMSVKEAIGRSRALMAGNKFEAFLLDLSFIGWNMLSMFCCGLPAILYVNPYIQYTETELYVKLCQGDNYRCPSEAEDNMETYSNM